MVELFAPRFGWSPVMSADGSGRVGSRRAGSGRAGSGRLVLCKVADNRIGYIIEYR